MLNFSVTFLITIVNVTFLYLVLRRVLFKPVTKFMEARTNGIQKDLDSAKHAHERAEALAAEYEAKLKAVHEEGARFLQKTREKAELEAATIRAEAKAEAAALISSALADLEDERRRVELALRTETADLSIRAASRILETNLDTGTNRELVKKFLDSVGVA